MDFQPHYGPPRDDGEVDAFVRHASWAFRSPPELLRGAYGRLGHTPVRVWRDGDRVVGGLHLYDQAQWWGGRAVPLAGVGAVAMTPEGRGRGGATALMTAALREAREAGRPLSALYPAKQTLYRRVGYELAGTRWRIQAPVASLPRGERGLPVREIVDADRESIREAHAHAGEPWNGPLRRSPWDWDRIEHPRASESRGWVVDGDDGPEGWIWMRTMEGEGFRHDIEAVDLTARTGRAARRLLSFLADHASVVGKVAWFGQPADPLVLALPEQTFEARVAFLWMLRVVDVPAALEARGWPAGVHAAFGLEIADDVIEENRGRFRVEIEGGRARVRPGGDGSVRMPVGTLASLYSGFTTPDAMARAGLLEGHGEDLAPLRTAFAGPAPWMQEMF